MGTRWAGMSESMRGRDTNKQRRTSRTGSRIHLHSTSAFLSSSSPTQQPSLPLPPHTSSPLNLTPSCQPSHRLCPCTRVSVGMSFNIRDPCLMRWAYHHTCLGASSLPIASSASNNIKRLSTPHHHHYCRARGRIIPKA